MLFNSLWITGGSRSGKTTRLVNQFCTWSQAHKPFSATKDRQRVPHHRTAAILVLAANGDNRLDLADRIAEATQGQQSFHSTTPLGFFEDEVVLFWPLLIQSLDLRAQFPLRLRPETEQELAMRLWRPELDQGILGQRVNADRMVRRTLDLFQLAAQSGTPREEIPRILEQGMAGEEGATTALEMGKLLDKWREWCLVRGLLTYGTICELYWRYLLPDPTYQQHLTARYQAVLADDVDEYPAISRHLFEFLLDRTAVGAFTYNPEGGIRVGLGADPNYLAGLSDRCRQENLDRPSGLAAEIGESAVNLALNSFIQYRPVILSSASVLSIQTTSRAQLLRTTAEAIATAVKSGEVEPGEVAAIAPGLDAIARYSLIEILTRQGIAVESLNDQRPLSSSPTIRALLTLLALVYPGLGRLVDRDAVAEMLIVLSRRQQTRGEQEVDSPDPAAISHPSPTPAIDPVRAGLLADHCFSPELENPRLLPITAFPRWDRLGRRAATAYNQILEWLEEQRSQQQQRLLPSPISLLDRAMQKFILSGNNLPYDQLAALRELIETAVHYWEIGGRLRQIEPSASWASATVAQFIQLLRRGVVTANPFPVRAFGNRRQAVTLATIFQYRNHRRAHKWHFWLDAGSPLWMMGGAATLFGAPLFLQERIGHPWGAEDTEKANEERLRRILTDLLSRVSDRLYLCHSDLAVNGQEQTGPMLPLIHAAAPSSISATLPGNRDELRKL